MLAYISACHMVLNLTDGDKMRKDDFADNVLGITYGHWRYVLTGERNLSLQKARIAASVLETGVDVWLDGSLASARIEAWERFNSSSNKESGGRPF